MAGFWDKLPKPFWALAPMEDVTDTVFRRIVAEVGKPNVMFTEFTNVDAIEHGSSLQSRMLDSPPQAGLAARARFTSSAPLSAGIPAPLQHLVFSEEERPIVAQIWGTEPEKFLGAAKIIKDLGFDGIDINFGCPVKKVSQIGACGAMIGKNDAVKEIIKATKEGAGGLPVSVKTRIGYKKIVTEEWVGFLLEQNLAAISIHGRTVAEESKVPAHWEEIGKAVRARDDKRETLIIGNGDVKNLQEAREKATQYGVDGVMIGRGIFTNPALFAEKVLSSPEKMDLYLKHIHMFAAQWGDTKNWQVLKKFMKVYINGFAGAGELREKLAGAKTAAELEQKLKAGR